MRNVRSSLRQSEQVNHLPDRSYIRYADSDAAESEHALSSVKEDMQRAAKVGSLSVRVFRGKITYIAQAARKPRQQTHLISTSEPRVLHEKALKGEAKSVAVE